MKEQFDKLNFIKVKYVCSSKENGNIMKRPVTDWRTYLPNIYLIETYPEHTKISQNSAMREQMNK